MHEIEIIEFIEEGQNFSRSHFRRPYLAFRK